MQVRTEQRIIEGEPGKAICAEAARLQPTAIVMGSRGRGVVKRYKFMYLTLNLLFTFFGSSFEG